MEAKRWDPIVKLTHWGIVAAVIGNALITEEGSGWHIWVGYGLAALLALRLLWGLVGPREARFTAFPPSLARVRSHLSEIREGQVTHHSSHNPLGALMVYAIWATLLGVIGTGIAMSGPPPANPSAVRGEHGEQGEGKEGGAAGAEAEADEATERSESAAAPVGPSGQQVQTAGRQARGEEEEEDEAAERRERREESGERTAAPAPIASGGADAAAAPAPVPPPAKAKPAVRAETDEDEEGEEEEEGPLGELHELAVNLLYVLIALHLMGVVFESRRSGPEVVRAMLPGGKRN